MKWHLKFRCLRGEKGMFCILVADDGKLNRRLIIDILSKKLNQGTFLEAENGKEVFEILKEENVDLLILDLIMPVKDGFSVLKTMKAHKKYKDIPVIVNSAITEISSIEMTLEMGAIDYFTKPLSQEDQQIILPLKAKNALLYHEQQKTIQALNREIQQELKNAYTFQKIMLPRSKNFYKLDLFVKYEPSLGIGGDCFDCFEKDKSIWFIIADVTGHGIAAGMASSMVKIMFRSAVNHLGETPKKILEHMNQNVFDTFDFEIGENYLMFTAFVGCIKDGKLIYANAGQPYPLVIDSQKKKVSILENSGVPVGVFEEGRYENKQVPLTPGDGVLLYTDGLFSAGERANFVAWDQVHDYSQIHCEKILSYPEMFLNELTQYFRGQEESASFSDDVAIMILKIKEQTLCAKDGH